MQSLWARLIIFVDAQYGGAVFKGSLYKEYFDKGQGLLHGSYSVRFNAGLCTGAERRTFLQSHTVVGLDCHGLVFCTAVLFSMAVPKESVTTNPMYLPGY